MIDQTNDAYDDLVLTVTAVVDPVLADATRELQKHPDSTPLDVKFLETNVIAALVHRMLSRWIAGEKEGADPEILGRAIGNLRNMLSYVSEQVGETPQCAVEPSPETPPVLH